jgi:hypothetical protein
MAMRRMKMYRRRKLMQDESIRSCFTNGKCKQKNDTQKLIIKTKTLRTAFSTIDK